MLYQLLKVVDNSVNYHVHYTHLMGGFVLLGYKIPRLIPEIQHWVSNELASQGECTLLVLECQLIS